MTRRSLSTAPTPSPAPARRAHLATFLELSDQIFCIADFDGAVTWCNTSFERVLAAQPGSVTGTSLRSIVHPEDLHLLSSPETSLPRLGELGPVPLRMRTTDGRWLWLEWTSHVDMGRERIYCAARDVTERRGAETALSDSAARLRAIVRHSPSIIFVKDLEGRYLMVNEGFGRAVGMSADLVVGRTTGDCWPADHAEVRRREQMLLDDDPSLVSDERLHTVDGARDFIVSRFLLRGEQGVPYAIGGIATDVTERLRAERTLAARDKLLDSVIKASPDMITLMDGAGKIHQISEARSAMFGYRYEEFTRSDLFTHVHPDDRDDVASVFVRLATGAASNLTFRYRVGHAEGHWVTVESRAQAVLDAERRFAAAVVVSRDITVQLEAERRLEESRTAVEHASRAKSEFLSRMSHELRTPLNSILGFAQLLQMDALPPQQDDAVAHILRAGRHLLDLIDEVLDIARIESGHLELVLADVALPEIVREAVDLTSPMAARAEVVMRCSFEGRDMTTVRADRQRLMQVLLNLLSNAVKYNRPGGKVEISCAALTDASVRLAVADTGRGIRPDDLDRVFAPFDRLGMEQAGIEGTGVGLALSKHLCERMGGHLSLESVYEVGTTFFVDMPAGTAGHEGDGTAVSPENGRGAAHGIEGRRGDQAVPADAGTFRVLLVEDNLATLDLVERVLLRRPGTEVLAAMQGGLGAEFAREHQPDLILLDMHLPDMSGGAVLDRLAEDATTAAIPVAVVGTDASAAEVRQLLGRGVAGFLAKPIDVRGLLSLVDAVRAARGA